MRIEIVPQECYNIDVINRLQQTREVKHHEKDCNAKQSKELFDCVVNIVKNGGAVEIRKNNFNYTVNVLVEEAKHEFRGTEIIYYLSRPMTEAERIEADLYTGRNK